MASQLQINWTPAGGSNSISQDVLYKRDIDGAFITAVAGLGPAIATYTILAALEDNRIYLSKIINNCNGGGQFASPLQKSIKFACPNISATELTQTKLTVQFLHTPSSINQYIIKLYDATGTNLVDQVIVNDQAVLGVNSSISHQFTGLTPNTIYKVRVELYADTLSKLDCAFFSWQTSNTPACTAPAVTSAVVS
jgi:hypothetical protein